jgi:hypothetical protein
VGTARGARCRWLTIGVELFVLVMALYGGIGLIANNAIGMLDEWLGGTPFTGWLWPGVLLLVVVALPMAVAMLLELGGSAWAAAASVVAGAALTGRNGAQLAVMQRYNFQQPIMLGCGLGVVLLALWATRHRPLLAPRRGGRPGESTER